MSPEVVPYNNAGESKKLQVRKMFDNIAHRYDFLNHFLSFGTDRAWRRKAIRKLKEHNPISILDVATGTGDFAMEAMRISPQSVTGVDISEEMLSIAREKVAKAGLGNQISFQWADAEELPFAAESFDASTVAFGVRNFENVLKGLSEINRVLKTGGILVILEFSMPTRFPFRQVYAFYFRKLLPLIGKWVSKDHSAYTYLPDSVSAFPQGDEFTGWLLRAGFREAEFKPLTFGVVNLYMARK